MKSLERTPWAKGIDGVFCAKKETKDHQKEARKEEPAVGVFMSRGRSDFSDKQYKYAVLKAYGFFSRCKGE